MAKQSQSRKDGDVLTKEHIERLRPIFIEAMTDSEGEYPEQIEIIVDMALKWMAHCENAPRSEQQQNDAARWRWLLDNATRMSEPLYERDAKGGFVKGPVTGHRVSLIVSFKGDYRSTPWTTQESFTEHVDMERLSERLDETKGEKHA